MVMAFNLNCPFSITPFESIMKRPHIPRNSHHSMGHPGQCLSRMLKPKIISEVKSFILAFVFVFVFTFFIKSFYFSIVFYFGKLNLNCDYKYHRVRSIRNVNVRVSTFWRFWIFRYSSFRACIWLFTVDNRHTHPPLPFVGLDPPSNHFIWHTIVHMSRKPTYPFDIEGTAKIFILCTFKFTTTRSTYIFNGLSRSVSVACSRPHPSSPPPILASPAFPVSVIVRGRWVLLLLFCTRIVMTNARSSMFWRHASTTIYFRFSFLGCCCCFIFSYFFRFVFGLFWFGRLFCDISCLTHPRLGWRLSRMLMINTMRAPMFRSNDSMGEWNQIVNRQSIQKR